ncbi:hypothetical protein MJO28_016992 [Puccinia striiformis f. sp. tritici]|nr:hypothetical protein MJO28_016992 [Puccinia striiformis f. sp. tritici]
MIRNLQGGFCLRGGNRKAGIVKTESRAYDLMRWCSPLKFDAPGKTKPSKRMLVKTLLKVLNMTWKGGGASERRLIPLTPLWYSRDGNSDPPRSKMVDPVELRIKTRPTHLNTQTLKTPLSVEYSRDRNSDLPRSNMVDPVELRIQTRPTPHLNTQAL